MTDDLERLGSTLEQIDALWGRYESRQPEPERTVGSLLAERAEQNPLLEKIIDLATEALAEYPNNPALLHQRAIAKRLVV